MNNIKLNKIKYFDEIFVSGWVAQLEQQVSLCWLKQMQQSLEVMYKKCGNLIECEIYKCTVHQHTQIRHNTMSTDR